MAGRLAGQLDVFWRQGMGALSAGPSTKGPLLVVFGPFAALHFAALRLTASGLAGMIESLLFRPGSAQEHTR